MRDVFPMRIARMLRWWSPWTQAWDCWNPAWPPTPSTCSWSGAGRRWAQEASNVSSRKVSEWQDKQMEKCCVIMHFLCSRWQKPDDRPSFALLLHELASLSEMWTMTKVVDNLFCFLFFFLKKTLIYLIYGFNCVLFIKCFFIKDLKLLHSVIIKTIFNPWLLHFICVSSVHSSWECFCIAAVAYCNYM